jgi:hypothetical protein
VDAPPPPLDHINPLKPVQALPESTHRSRWQLTMGLALVFGVAVAAAMVTPHEALPLSWPPRKSASGVASSPTTAGHPNTRG